MYEMDGSDAGVDFRTSGNGSVFNPAHLVFNATARPEPCEYIAPGLEDNQALLEQFSFSEPLPNEHLLAGLVTVDLKYRS
jgi:hypothetical protein